MWPDIGGLTRGLFVFETVLPAGLRSDRGLRCIGVAFGGLVPEEVGCANTGGSRRDSTNSSGIAIRDDADGMRCEVGSSASRRPIMCRCSTLHAMARMRVSSGSPYEEQYGFSRGIRVGDRIEIAGTAPIPPPGEAVAGTAHAQMLRCGHIAIAALGDLGATAADVVRTVVYITDPADADEIGRAHAELFGEAAPVATMVVVQQLLDEAWKVEIEVSAIVSGPSS
jgi:enamine deaminase RidA (YjgF/YER057c/UK114 family)